MGVRDNNNNNNPITVCSLLNGIKEQDCDTITVLGTRNGRQTFTVIASNRGDVFEILEAGREAKQAKRNADFKAEQRRIKAMEREVIIKAKGKKPRTSKSKGKVGRRSARVK